MNIELELHEQEEPNYLTNVVLVVLVPRTVFPNKRALRDNIFDLSNSNPHHQDNTKANYNDFQPDNIPNNISHPSDLDNKCHSPGTLHWGNSRRLLRYMARHNISHRTRFCWVDSRFR